MFFDFYNGTQAAVATEKWMDELKRKLSWDYWFPIAFMGLTALRTNEVIASLNLISDGELERGSKQGFDNARTLQI